MGKQMVVTDADFSANGIYGLNLAEKYKWDSLATTFTLPGVYIYANLKDIDGTVLNQRSAVGIQTRFNTIGVFTAVLVDLTDGTYTDVKTFEVKTANSVESYFFDTPVTIPNGKALGVKFDTMQFDDGSHSRASIFQVKPTGAYAIVDGVIMPWKTIISFKW